MKASLFFLAAILILASLFVLPSCSKEKAPEKAKAATARYTRLEDMPESERQELDALGRKLQADLRAKDIAAAKSAFHLPGMADLLMDGVNVSGPSVDKFRGGVKKGLNEGIDFVIKTWTENEITYKHLAIHDGKVTLRFRISSIESGIIFLDFVAQRRPDGRLGVVNYYNHSVGDSMVEQSRQNALPVLAELDKGFLERVFNKPSESAFKDLELIGEMTKDFQKKDFQGIINGYHKLSPESQRRKLTTVLYLTALQGTQDNQTYKAVLKEAAKRQDSANFQFMLIDLYSLEGNHDKSIECVDTIMATLERDAALLAIKSVFLQNKGSLDVAMEVAKEALALEPDSVFVHMKCLDVFLAAKNHAAVASSLRFVEANSPYNFKGALGGDPVWADFVKSPESEPWR